MHIRKYVEYVHQEVEYAHQEVDQEVHRVCTSGSRVCTSGSRSGSTWSMYTGCVFVQVCSQLSLTRGRKANS